MSLSLFTFLAVILCWFGFAAVFLFRKRPSKAVESKRNPAARYGILLQAVGVAFVWARRPHDPLTGELATLPAEIILSVVTVLIAAGSVVLVMMAVRTLGKQWTLQAQIVEGHELITRGPYALVRNPIYLGMFGLVIATGLAGGHWLRLLVAVIVFLIGTVIRVRSEEKLLRETFGTEFDAYTRRVKALIPGVY